MTTITGTVIEVTEQGWVTVTYPSGHIEDYQIDPALAKVLNKVAK